jgi:hypothetical protein
MSSHGDIIKVARQYFETANFPHGSRWRSNLEKSPLIGCENRIIILLPLTFVETVLTSPPVFGCSRCGFYPAEHSSHPSER